MKKERETSIYKCRGRDVDKKYNQLHSNRHNGLDAETMMHIAQSIGQDVYNQIEQDAQNQMYKNKNIEQEAKNDIWNKRHEIQVIEFNALDSLDKIQCIEDYVYRMQIIQ